MPGTVDTAALTAWVREFGRLIAAEKDFDQGFEHFQGPREHFLTVLADVPLLPDTTERMWSVAALKAAHAGREIATITPETAKVGIDDGGMFQQGKTQASDVKFQVYTEKPPEAGESGDTLVPEIPHSEYMEPVKYDELRKDTQGEFGGVGNTSIDLGFVKIPVPSF